MNRIENLQYAVIGKFIYDITYMEELRLNIPKQCDIKGEPVQIDLATINRTKPSCARVKVQVDLKSNLPKVVMMDIVDERSGEVRSEKGESNQEKSAENSVEKKKHPDRECSWNVVKDNRFAALTEENLAEEAFNNASSSYANGPNPCIKNNIQQRGHQGSQEGQLEASTREWVRQSFETSPNNQAQRMVERATIDTSAKQNIDDQLQHMSVNVEKEKEVNARTKNMTIHDASNESNLCTGEDVHMETVTNAVMGDVDRVMDANMVDKSNEDDNSDNQCDNSKAVIIFNGDQGATTDSEQAITIIHNQADAIQVVSHHRVLHDIITHNIEQEDVGRIEYNQAVGVPEIDPYEEVQNNLPLEADLSPKLIQFVRKGKKQEIGDVK
ncbi:hypothetical protein KY289_030305 [Solanum tuberosum]|nr:hypothetical protein KY289_030305 [Solanum tuberosum]